MLEKEFDATLSQASNKNAEAQLRRDAVWALYHYNDKQATSLLVNILKDQHEDYSLRECAASVLSQLIDRDAIEYLAPLLSDNDEYIRYIAIFALRQIKDTRDLKQVSQYLGQLSKNDPSENVRFAASKTIEYIK